MVIRQKKYKLKDFATHWAVKPKILFGTTYSPGKVGGHKVTRIKAYLSVISGYPALLNVTAMKVLSRKKQKFFFLFLLTVLMTITTKRKKNIMGLP